MINKVIDFIIKEGRQEVRKSFAEVEFGEEPRYNLNPYDEFDLEALKRYFTRKQYYHRVEELAQIYIHGTRSMNGFLQGIPSLAAQFQEPDAGYRFLTAVPIAFAPPDVVKNKLKTECAGLYYEKEGIFVSADLYSNDLFGTIIHEYAHYLHDKLFSHTFNKSSIMDETMAIFAEEEFGHDSEYEASPHYKAKKILQQVKELPAFVQMNRGERWDFLVKFDSYRKLQRYLAQKQESATVASQLELLIPQA